MLYYKIGGKMKRKISLGISIIGIICMLAGASLLVVNVNNGKKEYESLKTSIVNDYEDFKVKIESFSEERTNIYNSLNEITYLTDLSVNYDKLVQEYKDYELTLQEIENSSKNLKVNCYKKDYIETDINNKVSAFTINYEQAVNYYIQDVEAFNEKVRNYNNWIQTSQVATTYVELAEFESSYKEYVDINGDGIYNGVNK